jgi:beta-glucanase (GH16 family)
LGSAAEGGFADILFRGILRAHPSDSNIPLIMLRPATLLSLALTVGAQYVQVFVDHFAGTTLDKSRWNVWDNQTHGDKEWQLYMSDDVYVRDGNLVIRTQARDVSYGSKPYHFTSGWVDSSKKVEATYGMFSARIKLPLELPGLWPAYWLVQDQTYCWPVGAEIDILEAVGGFRNDSVFGTYHWGQQCGKDEWEADGSRNGDYPHPPSGPFSSDFHNFTVWWNKTMVTWAVDGHPYVSRVAGQPSNLFIPSWDMFIIFNTALSFWAGPQPPPRDNYPQEMLVDFVGVWKWGGEGGATGDFPIPVRLHVHVCGECVCVCVSRLCPFPSYPPPPHSFPSPSSVQWHRPWSPKITAEWGPACHVTCCRRLHHCCAFKAQESVFVGGNLLEGC